MTLGASSLLQLCGLFFPLPATLPGPLMICPKTLTALSLMILVHSDAAKVPQNAEAALIAPHDQYRTWHDAQHCSCQALI